MNDIKNKPGIRKQSIKSVKSVKSILESTSTVEKPIDLEEYIKNACRKFPCQYKFTVKRDLQADEYLKLIKQESSGRYKRVSLAAPLARQAVNATSAPSSEKETEDTTSKATTVDDDAIPIMALYDNLNRIAEVLLQKIRVPRILIQILGLILPQYLHLTKMSLIKCQIDAYTIYEIRKFLPLSSITEICLDESPVIPEANYAILLETQSSLTSLSLCRCKINDLVCMQIAAKLHTLEPAEATLLTLNLSSNHITDEGAKHIGEALRTNRHLRYLNLADNRIGDDGADHIFNALIDFPLTYDETMLNRQRYMAYLRQKRALYLKFYMESDSKSSDDLSMIFKKSARKSVPTPAKAKPRKDKIKPGATLGVDEFSTARAEALASEMIGPFTDPFVSSIKFVDGYSHCIGNMALSYLNLCYNDLSYMTFKKLQTVLFYQSVNKKPNQSGLMRVLVEGNPLPLGIRETDRIAEMLNTNVINFSSKYTKKTRARMSIVPERK